MTILRLNLTIIFIFLLTITAFAQVQVKKVNLKKIEFSSQTRGYQELIGIDKNSMDIKQTGTTSREEHLKKTGKYLKISYSK
jgi:hypothetical protein